MRRGMKLQRRAVSRPLLPPALRRPAAAVVTGCAAVTASLALAFAGQARPDGLDRAVDAHVRSGLAPYQGQLHLLAELGDLVPVTVLTAALILACLATRRRRGAALACLAVPGAVALTEYVLKPLVGRTIHGAYLCFPSGHATASFAMATTCAVLLASPARRGLAGAVRLLLALGAAVVAADVATAMVALGHHYFTDAVAGTAVGVGTVLLTALFIDRAARSPRAWSPPHLASDPPVTTAPHVSISSPGPVGR
jgi:membrane-associated phospholipid phosphatase